MGANKEVDWGLLDADWRAGIKNPRQMADDYNLLTGDKVSHSGITKHFEKLGIPRDLGAKIRARADEIVNRSAVESTGELTNQPKIADEAIVEACATTAANLVLGHRATIERYRAIAKRLLDEIETTTDNRDLFENLGELLRKENDRGVDKINDCYRKVISMPSRVSAFKQLAEVLKILVGLERQAYGLADNAEGGKNPTQTEAPQVGTAGINDAARRVAFLFMSATRESKK